MMAEKYTSTLLPQDNTPQENQKAVLDLLKKTNQVHDDATSGINAAKAELQKQINMISGSIHAYVCAAGNPSTGANVAIQFTETLDTHNLYSAGIFTAPKDGIIIISACCAVNTTAVIFLGKNANANYLFMQTTSGAFAGSGTVMTPALGGDIFYIVSASGAVAYSESSLGIEFIEIK